MKMDFKSVHITAFAMIKKVKVEILLKYLKFSKKLMKKA